MTGRDKVRRFAELDHSMARNGSVAESVVAIDRAGGIPLYRQIYERLREGILAGTLPESSRLPPERTLAAQLRVNRSTVVATSPTRSFSR